jgi:predicted RNase H-like nuclease (RuvC/YqgF family)
MIQRGRDIQRSRGIHNVSLPVHSEDTVYTRSALAFSRKEAQAQAQMEICALRREVEDMRQIIAQRDAVIGEKEAGMRDKDRELVRLRQELMQKSNMVRRLEDEVKGRKRADRMMELMGLRELGREAYDPL